MGGSDECMSESRLLNSHCLARNEHGWEGEQLTPEPEYLPVDRQ